MKYIKGVFALFLILKGGLGVYKYASDYSHLSSYGKGYLFGNLILLLIGIILFVLLIRKRNIAR